MERVIAALALPAPVLALQSDVGPNDFAYLMYRHRLGGNRHPLLVFGSARPFCLLSADLNDAAGGILSEAAGSTLCQAF